MRDAQAALRGDEPALDERDVHLLAQSLGILHPDAGVALRATFLVDPGGIVRFAAANDLDVGRSVAEVLRVLDALRTGELTACEWHRGERTLSDSVRNSKNS